jgi:hypothetical protein
MGGERPYKEEEEGALSGAVWTGTREERVEGDVYGGERGGEGGEHWGGDRKGDGP